MLSQTRNEGDNRGVLEEARSLVRLSVLGNVVVKEFCIEPLCEMIKIIC